MSAVVERRIRVGYDLSYIRGPYTVMVEYAYGRNFDLNVQNALVEWSWQNPSAHLTAYTQFRYLGEEIEGAYWKRTTSSTVGISCRTGDRSSLSFQYYRVLSDMAESKDRVMQMQLRYYY